MRSRGDVATRNNAWKRVVARAGIDADMLVKVFSLPEGAEVCEGTAGLFTGCAAGVFNGVNGIIFRWDCSI